MNRLLIITALILGAYTSLFSQCFYGEAPSIYQNVSYEIFYIPLDTAFLKNLKISENTQSKSYDQLYSELKNDEGFFFECGYSDNGQHVGLLKSDNNQWQVLDTGQGNGNFYLKPNGVLSWNSQDASINTTENFDPSRTIITQAIQSGPMLLINGQIHDQFRKASTNQHIRTGVGITSIKGQDYLVFARSQSSVNLYSFADFFRSKLKCRDALCLGSANVGACYSYLGCYGNSSKAPDFFISFTP